MEALQNVQGHDELIDLIIKHEGEPSQEELVGFVDALNEPGRDLKLYLDDFDFVNRYFESATGSYVDVHWQSMRDLIADFYHVNDMVFHTLVMMYLSHLYDVYGNAPFYALPNSPFFAMSLVQLNEYTKTPNEILILITN